MHHPLEVGANLADGGQLVEPLVPAELVDAVAAQPAGVHAVVRRRLMQANKRVSPVPVPTGRMTSVDDHHLRVGLGHQGVGERHAHRARADDQVISLKCCHTSSSPWCRRYRIPQSGRDL